MKQSATLTPKQKLQNALKFLEKGEASFNKAAKIAGLDVWSFADEVQKSGIIWIKDDVERFRQELRRA